MTERALTGVRVLVVDDYEDALLLLDAVLSRYGAEVTSAMSAADALAVAAECKPHVLVLDLSMPVVDGFQLLGRLRASLGRVPAIACTALTGHEVEIEAEAAGFDSIVHKPADFGQLSAAIARLARAGRSPGPG